VTSTLLIVLSKHGDPVLENYLREQHNTSEILSLECLDRFWVITNLIMLLLSMIITPPVVLPLIGLILITILQLLPIILPLLVLQLTILPHLLPFITILLLLILPVLLLLLTFAVT